MYVIYTISTGEPLNAQSSADVTNDQVAVWEGDDWREALEAYHYPNGVKTWRGLAQETAEDQLAAIRLKAAEADLNMA